MSSCTIHLAFRFHVNFYHSYRGDSLDEKGIGKDIRVIGGLLDDLDRLNREGAPVRGTWDIENYYSLQYMMRQFAPQLIERIRSRAETGQDEIEPMSYNNGLVAASTPEEFDLQVELMKSNEGGSGLDDLFSTWKPILRPQESMYTPSFLRLYPEKGIPVISLYYSAIPFNAFSNFTKPLPCGERYNPLLLKSRHQQGSMILLPAYNHGDIAEHFLSLRGWLKRIRKEQLAMEKPQDLLLLIDADADDQFWAGMDIPIVCSLAPSFDGFYRLVRSVADLPWLTFTTPGAYLEKHSPAGTIYLEQDTADGSFDGYSSWAEKWENVQLWNLIQKSRDLWDYGHYLCDQNSAPSGGPANGEETRILRESLHSRLLALSTTHFGMASPVMNKDRLQDGLNFARQALETAQKLIDKLKERPEAGDPQKLIFPRQLEQPEISGYIPSPDSDCRELLFIRLEAGSRTGTPRQPEIAPEAAPAPAAPFTLSLPRISYGKKSFQGKLVGETEKRDPYGVHLLRHEGSLSLPGGNAGRWWKEIRRTADDDALFLEMEVHYPQTPDHGWDRRKAKNLNRTWDHRWKETVPAEILPDFTATEDQPFRIIKHNFFGDTGSYPVDYHLYSKNRRVPSINNHITNGWVAVSNGKQGILVAQHTGLDNNFAFCPMRTWFKGDAQHISLNPFGTWYGPQYRYATAVSGIGRRLAIMTADQLDSYAPSWNGKSLHIALAIFPFQGEMPSEELRGRALLFAAAPLGL